MLYNIFFIFVDLTEYFYATKAVNEACDSKREFKQGFSFRVCSENDLNAISNN